MDVDWVRRGGGLAVDGQSCEGVLLQKEDRLLGEAVAETSEMLSWLWRLLTLRLAPSLGCCLVYCVGGPVLRAGLQDHGHQGTHTAHITQTPSHLTSFI
jgi:hypothetical protein